MNGRLRMSREHAVAGLEQLVERGEVLAVERPVRVFVQLLVALVEAIDRREERFRIGDVDRDRHPERAAGSHIGSKRGSSIFTSGPVSTLLAQIRGRAS